MATRPNSLAFCGRKEKEERDDEPLPYGCSILIQKLTPHSPLNFPSPVRDARRFILKQIPTPTSIPMSTDSICDDSYSPWDPHPLTLSESSIHPSQGSLKRRMAVTDMVPDKEFA
jgi:hypothetical protein